MKIFTRILVVLGTLMVLFLMGYLSNIGRVIEAYLCTALLFIVRWPVSKYTPSWWRIKTDPALLVGIMVIASFTKGMGTGYEYGDYAARLTCEIIAVTLLFLLLLHDFYPLKKV